jgi:geranylgeranyl diphosphate synthase, type I
MFEEIKNKVEKSLRAHASSLGKIHRLDRISPVIAALIKNYVLRPGKRVRPVLFVAGYLGFARKERPGLYTSCLSIELLHDFMLIHDDIIDKSDTRRGKPSMHRMLAQRIAASRQNVKFNGQDLSIVIGDILYAMAIDAFLAIKEEPARKEKGLQRFIEAAMYTGSGEFIELMYGLSGIDTMRKQDIYKIYDYKTACYTFACPLSIGAILGGASDTDVQRLFDYGIYLGRAFQIKDDILGMFGKEQEIGKSTLTDLQEAKKTLLVFYAYRDSSNRDRAQIKRILTKENVDRADLEEMRAIINRSGSLAKASQEVADYAKKSSLLLEHCAVKPAVKHGLAAYSRQLLKL